MFWEKPGLCASVQCFFFLFLFLQQVSSAVGHAEGPARALKATATCRETEVK